VGRERIKEDVMELVLSKAYEATTAVLAAVRRWDAPSPCAEWTVREVANHLVGAMAAFAAAIDGGPAEECTGDDPAGAYVAEAARCRAAFARPGALAAVHPFPFGPTPGAVIARISLSESLVHGWDIARGAGVAYEPAPEVVSAVLSSAGGEVSEGMFAPPVPPPPGADDLTVLLARLGRVS
jgi:uncharacterized protein (TIGR03086 family)